MDSEYFLSLLSFCIIYSKVHPLPPVYFSYPFFLCYSDFFTTRDGNSLLSLDYENDRNTASELSSSRMETKTTRQSSTSASRCETKTADQHSSTTTTLITTGPPPCPTTGCTTPMWISKNTAYTCNICRKNCGAGERWICHEHRNDYCFECYARSPHCNLGHNFGSIIATCYGSTFERSLILPKLFTDSVKQMNAGIIRNAFNHFGKNTERLPGWKECLHEIIQPWEPGWDAHAGWSTRKECTCDDCKKVLSRERWNQELSHFDDILTEDSTRTALLRDTGIRVDVLVAFAIDHDCWEWPTWRVVRDIIQPATRSTRCRYGDLPGMKENNYFGPATIFVSHTWTAPFGNLVAAASQGAKYNRYVWVDIFAVRQWPGNMADLNFRPVIEASTAMVVSVSPVKGLAEHREQTKGVCERVVCPGLLLISLPGAFIYSVYNVILNGIVYEGFLNSVSCLFLTLVCFYFFGIVFHFFKNYLCHYNRNYSLTNIMMDFGYEMQYNPAGGCYCFFNLMQFSQKQFLETEEGKEAKKNIFFFRLWCVVEVASAVENKKPIIVKGGKATKNEEGIYEYDQKSLGDMFLNLEDMVDIASSECAVPADKVRELKTIYDKFGENCNTIINEMVSSVISGARVAEENNVIEIDSASCGEIESLDHLYTGLEPTETEIEVASTILIAACASGRRRIVEILIEHWKENKQGFCNLIDSSKSLSWAAKFGHIDVVRLLLKIGGIDVNAGNALHLACQHNKLQVVNMLLQEDRLRIDGEVNISQETKGSSVEELNSLHNSLIDPNQINQFEVFARTPLSIARWNSHTEIEQCLLQYPGINKKCTYNYAGRIFYTIFVSVTLLLLYPLYLCFTPPTGFLKFMIGSLLISNELCLMIFLAILGTQYLYTTYLRYISLGFVLCIIGILSFIFIITSTDWQDEHCLCQLRYNSNDYINYTKLSTCTNVTKDFCDSTWREDTQCSLPIGCKLIKKCNYDITYYIPGDKVWCKFF